MDKKDTKKFEEQYWKEDASALRTFEEIENKLREGRNFYINELSDERKKINFEDEYKSIFQLNDFDKDFAHELVGDINLGATSNSTRSWILTNGMYQAYKTNDMSILKDALHTGKSCVLSK